MFQLAVTIGILAAQLINYGTAEVSWGWRLSLGLAGVPAAILFIGSLVLPETPNSLIERGRTEEGKAVLRKLRGADDVEVRWARRGVGWGVVGPLPAVPAAAPPCARHPLRCSHLAQPSNHPPSSPTLDRWSTRTLWRPPRWPPASACASPGPPSSPASTAPWCARVGWVARGRLSRAGGLWATDACERSSAAHVVCSLGVAGAAPPCKRRPACLPLTPSPPPAPPAAPAQLIVTASIAMLQQLTGINAIMFCECGSLDAWLARRLAAAGAAAVALHSELAHRVMHAPLLTPHAPTPRPTPHPTHADAPAIFSSLGSGRSGSLMNTVIIGAVNVVSTFVSIFSVDRFGRRGLFLEGGVQMILGQVVAGIMLAVEFNGQGLTAAELPTGVAIGLLVVICVYVSAFAWSWGPLGWLVPSEIQTLETRPAGMAMAVSVNFLFSFVIGQAFLSVSLCGGGGAAGGLLGGCVAGARRALLLLGRCCYSARRLPACLSHGPPPPNPLTHPPPPPTAQMMCAMEWGVFLFFAAWILLMTLGVAFFLPETKGVPVESVPALFARHWAWRRVMGPAADLAQRLADLCGHFGTRILASGAVLSAAESAGAVPGPVTRRALGGLKVESTGRQAELFALGPSAEPQSRA